MLAPFDQTAAVPVVTIARAADAVPLAEALLQGGLAVIEITLRTPAALAAIEAIAKHLPEAKPGAGTVLTREDAAAAERAGAKFLVSPGLTAELSAAARESTLPFLPGAATASEVMRARELGFRSLKFFPAAQAGGVAALKAFAPVFADVDFCPTGGVTAENAAEYLALANVSVVGGAWMASREAIAAADWSGITARARAAAAAALRS